MELEDWIEEGDWPNVCFWRRIRAVLHGYVYLVGIIGIIMRSFGGTGVQNGIGWWVAFSFDGTRGGGTREGKSERGKGWGVTAMHYSVWIVFDG